MNIQKILKSHKLWLDTGGKEGQRGSLRRAELSGADLRGADVCVADLSGADFRFADLRGADLSRTYLSDADFRGADFSGACLLYADLSGADLSDADLSGADVLYANLTNIKGKELRTFQGSVHQAVANLTDKELRIGCEVHSIDYWLKNYKSIGLKNKYTNKEIKEYGTFIKSLVPWYRRLFR